MIDAETEAAKWNAENSWRSGQIVRIDPPAPRVVRPGTSADLLITAVNGLGVIRSVSMSLIYEALFRASILSAVLD
jgi:hypothetical protein